MAKVESLALALLRDRVESYLQEAIGHWDTDADGDYGFTHESARVFVCPRMWTGDKTVVRVFSVTNLGLAATPELMEHLVTENFHLTFGHFAYNENDGSVWFIHNLLGDFLDREELLTAVRMVASQANQYDDRIKDRFGGRLFTDAEPAGR